MCFYFFPEFYLFFYGCAESLAVQAFPLVLTHRGYSLASVCRFFLLQSTGSRVHRLQQLWHVGSVVAAPRLWSTDLVVVAHRLSCCVACGIFLDQGSDVCLLGQQVDSLPVRKIFWRRKWQPTPIFLPGKYHGQRSLAGYSPWSRKKSDMIQRQILHQHHQHQGNRPLIFFKTKFFAKSKRQRI